MKKFLCTCAVVCFILGISAAAQADICTWTYDPDDITVVAEDTAGINEGNLVSAVNYSFDLSSASDSGASLSSLDDIISITLEVTLGAGQSLQIATTRINEAWLGLTFWSTSEKTDIFTLTTADITGTTIDFKLEFGDTEYSSGLSSAAFTFDKVALTVETAAVPVPGSFLLLGSAVGVLALVRRKN